MIPTLPEIECACANIRRAARFVTQLYSDEMGHGIEPSQFSIMTILTRKPGLPQSAMGRYLGLDKTTMSRNLRLMERNGWIGPVKTDDQRERGYRLSAIGSELFSQTVPGWKRAQKKLRQALPEGDWDRMLKMFGQVAQAAQSARSAGTEPRVSTSGLRDARVPK